MRARHVRLFGKGRRLLSGAPPPPPPPQVAVIMADRCSPKMARAALYLDKDAFENEIRQARGACGEGREGVRGKGEWQEGGVSGGTARFTPHPPPAARHPPPLPPCLNARHTSCPPLQLIGETHDGDVL